MPWITVALALSGRLFVAAAFAVFYVMIGELLPTVLRAQAIGLASFITGLGLLACPFIVHLVSKCYNYFMGFITLHSPFYRFLKILRTAPFSLEFLTASFCFLVGFIFDFGLLWSEQFNGC